MDKEIKYNNDILKEYLLSEDKKIKSVEITGTHYYDDYINVFTIIKTNKEEMGYIKNIKYNTIDFTLRINKLKKIKEQIKKNKFKKFLNLFNIK